MTSPLISSALLGLIILGLVKLWSRYRFNKKYKFPPGPEGIPYFGNMFQMPPYHQGPWAKDLAEKNGEMFTIKIADNTWVFLNSSRTINALLEKRSAIYSSRPRYPYASTILSGDCRMVIQPYGPQWRAIRKIMHSILNIKNAPTFAPFQDIESKHMLLDYLERPNEWFKANQRFANSVVMSVVFGKRMQLGDQNTEKLFETANEFIAALQPGANLVDTFYVLDRLPGWCKWWRSRGEKGHEKVLSVYKTEVADLKRRMDNGTCPPCFATHFLSSPDTPSLGETQTLFALGSLIEAGSDTSRMILSQLIAAAATDPRWVRIAQEELDSVCTRSDILRLPDFSDRRKLRYISAVTKEILRWRPFAEFGMPHLLTQDDEFEGYSFPAGTVFTWNAWGIALDGREYPEPERFWPERWLPGGVNFEGLGDGSAGLEDPLRGHWSFGCGRRVCAGYHVGDTNVWIATARLLYCFDFEEDKENRIDTLNMPVGEVQRAPFEVKIRVRSDNHEELVRREGGKAKEMGY